MVFAGWALATGGYPKIIFNASPPRERTGAPAPAWWEDVIFETMGQVSQPTHNAAHAGSLRMVNQLGHHSAANDIINWLMSGRADAFFFGDDLARKFATMWQRLPVGMWHKK